MIRRYLLPVLVLALLVSAVYGEQIWQSLNGNPIRDIQDWAQSVIKGFNDFISG
ncbi:MULTISPECIES: hypothetical protein [unclassified Vibrio]|uniref:hypothetical protein n=1 Tax=unclassified Vibrio TaxID=2614977 RepID=UPI0012E85481|nr:MULTISPECIES: hypothetical protein [unclassified Vibrio]